ncbi:MAG: tetratricopeptide repeat protein [Tannerella sp.]|jgi:tetratricopeptide (TPR) repeat protein|nr:tetratricopeptide repeat protein [Tannerella sp.]
MTIKEIHTHYADITDALNGGALKTAFDRIQNLIFGAQAHSFQNRLDELQETYRYMLHYHAEGFKDPMQEQIYARIRTGAYELADLVRDELLMAGSQNIYYVNRRQQSQHPVEAAALIEGLQTQIELEDRTHFELSVHLLFNRLWTTAFLSEAEALAIRKALQDERTPQPATCQAVSGLLLGLQMSFDREKLYLLFDAACHADEEVKIRAMIAICLTLYRYRQRTGYCPGIRERLDALAEMPGFKRIMRTIVLRFILARETEKVTHKMQEEFLPAMMKFAPKINPDALAELSGNDLNPEWEELLLSDGKLTKIMEEYGSLQEEGLDVMHSTVIHLKHFAFFRIASNWFLPFTSQHSTFRNSPKFNVILETMRQAFFMCNSDKYSLYFSFSRIPEEYRKALMQQMNSDFSEINEQHVLELKSKQNSAEHVAGQYIQDLYRFYKLFPHRMDFEDIFNWTLDFHLLPDLKPYLSDSETWLSIAELYLRKGYYEDAQTLYSQLTERDAQDEMLYQKLGYCKQMTGDLPGALAAYLRAELLKPDSKWLIRRIADCYRTLKQPAEALAFYLRYEQLSPDTVQTLIYIGHCHLELKNYGEALKYYFKADYLEPESRKAWRAIAWCSFLTGKYGQALHYYQKMLDHQPQTQDFLNAGHTEWALQHIRKALACYQSAVQAEAGDFEKFLTLFRQDIPDLIQAGIEPVEIPMLLDQLRYSI